QTRIVMKSLILELRCGLRMLGNSRGFVIVAVLTLAIGVGLTTAIFTLVQQLMLGALPVSQPSQLWRIGEYAYCCYSDGYSQGGGSGLPQNHWSLFSWEAYDFFRASTPAFQ